MIWSDFINKLIKAKKAKKVGGLSVPAITTLIFAGAFDEMIQERLAGGMNKIDTYNLMFSEVKSALKSKASLPTKKKTEMIGICDIKTELQLALWRQQVSPIECFSLLDLNKDIIQAIGFEAYCVDGQVHRTFPWRLRSKTKNNPVAKFLTDHWHDLFDEEKRSLLDSFAYGQRELHIIGIIVETKLSRYANGTKEMLKFKLFTGREYTGDIVVWPEANGEVKDYYKSVLKAQAIGIAHLKPNIYKDIYGAYLNSWYNLIR